MPLKTFLVGLDKIIFYLVYGVAVPLYRCGCVKIFLYMLKLPYVEGIKATMDVRTCCKEKIFSFVLYMNFPVGFNITVALSKSFHYGTNCTVVVDVFPLIFFSIGQKFSLNQSREYNI